MAKFFQSSFEFWAFKFTKQGPMLTTDKIEAIKIRRNQLHRIKQQTVSEMILPYWDYSKEFTPYSTSAAYSSVGVSPADQHRQTCFRSVMSKMLFMRAKGILYADDIVLASQPIEQHKEHLKL